MELTTLRSSASGERGEALRAATVRTPVLRNRVDIYIAHHAISELVCNCLLTAEVLTSGAHYTLRSTARVGSEEKHYVQQQYARQYI